MASSEKTITRLIQYRRILLQMMKEGNERIYSHELAALAGGTAPQVRRDLMAIGYNGGPRGYSIIALIDGISAVLDSQATMGVALAGVGNLGRALLAYFVGRHPKLEVRAAFDQDPAKIGRVIHGCRCYAITELSEIAERLEIRLGIITVPAEAAQRTATLMVQAGVRGILNFAPVRVWTPPNVHVDQIDVTTSLEKVAFYARQGETEKEPAKWQMQ